MTASLADDVAVLRLRVVHLKNVLAMSREMNRKVRKQRNRWKARIAAAESLIEDMQWMIDSNHASAPPAWIVADFREALTGSRDPIERENDCAG